MSTSTFNKFVCFVATVFLFLSCENASVAARPSFCITSPQSTWAYYDDAEITFTLNANTWNIVWHSSKDGYIGTGNGFTALLSSGHHSISATIDGDSFTVDVTVSARTWSSGDELVCLLGAKQLKRTLPSFRLYPYALACGTPIKSLSFGISQANQKPSIRHDVFETSAPVRDIGITRNRVPCGGAFRNPGVTKNRSRSVKGSGRTFRIINTKDPQGASHVKNATLLYVSNSVNAWVVDSGTGSSSKIIEVCKVVDSLVIPRVRAIWGDFADVDGDSHVAILFTDTINGEGLATGFFTPADFYAYSADSSSKHYNPSSNEMDILYLAIPDSSSSYSKETIIATAAHELTHAVNYTNKTWKRILAGESSAAQEELFLDEGWSHLSESLCGFGVSGGNLDFLNVKNTARYSMCGPDAMGIEDTPGRRGGMALFLSWLFWKKGGMAWDPLDQTIPIDTGGIAFLRAMASSPVTGWQCIGSAFGTPTKMLFENFATGLNMCRLPALSGMPIFDPITNEPVTIWPNPGTVGSEAHTMTVSLPLCVDAWKGGTLDLLPWSVALFTPAEEKLQREITVTLKESSPDSYVKFLLQQ
jgi:hypothetical protein